MESIIKEYCLPNGLTLHCSERTTHYYGGFYRVIIDISCDVPITAERLYEPASLGEALRLIGEHCIYQRRLERMGVPAEKIEEARTEIIDHFEAHSLPYLTHESFPRRVILSELAKAGKREDRIFSFNL